MSVGTDSIFSWGKMSRAHPRQPHKANIAPRMLTNAVVTKPVKANARPSAKTIGHRVFAGNITMGSGSGCVSVIGPAGSYFQSGSSGCLRSQSGRRLLTTGIAAKLYTAGGESVDHSRVHASHGSIPDFFPRKQDHSRFTTKTTIAAA